jgi:hypothetical protein
MLAPSTAPSRSAKRKPDEADVPSKLYRRADGVADAADAVMPDAPSPASGGMSVFGQAAGGSVRPTEETDLHKVAQRTKQLEHGRNTLAYDRYLRLVPRRRRDRDDPTHLRTPNPKEPSVSKRQFDGRVRDWRRKLHEFWDPVDTPAEAAADGAAAHPPSGVADPAAAHLAPNPASIAAQARLVGSEAPFSLDDCLDSGELDTPLADLGGSFPTVPAARASATVAGVRAPIALSAQTPRTRVVPKTAPMLSAAGASHAAGTACPVMAGLSPAGMTRTNSSNPLGVPSEGASAANKVSPCDATPALAAGEAAGFDLDAYLGDGLWGVSGQDVPRLPPAEIDLAGGMGSGVVAGGGMGGSGGCGGAATSGSSALRARLDAYKGARKAESATGVCDIYASWDGDEALVG